MSAFIEAYLDESLAAMAAFHDDSRARDTMRMMADGIVTSLRGGGKLLVCGNGGSAGDAQHIAGEFVSRLMFDRAPLAALALTTDSSVMTATGNDYGFVHVFERQVIALGRPGDVLLAISTSGTSANVLRALKAARERGLVCHGFSGAGGMDGCDAVLRAPSSRTAIIQQIHIVAAHIVCAVVERTMFDGPHA